MNQEITKLIFEIRMKLDKLEQIAGTVSQEKQSAKQILDAIFQIKNHDITDDQLNFINGLETYFMKNGHLTPKQNNALMTTFQKVVVLRD